MKKSKTKGAVEGLGVAAAIAATVAAAAGVYFIYGTKAGVKTKKKIKSWTLKAKAEVLEKLEKMKDVSEDSYKNTVETVMKKYDTLKAEHGDEVDLVKKELHGYWNHLKKHLNSVKKVVKKGKK